jgi:hypothetical protein
MSIDYPSKQLRERGRGHRTRNQPPVVGDERVGHQPRARGGELGGERGKKDPIIPAAAQARLAWTAAMRDVEVAGGTRTSAV